MGFKIIVNISNMAFWFYNTGNRVVKLIFFGINFVV